MNYSFHKVDLVKDKKQFLQFWSENHETELDNKFKWIYEENPSGKAIVSWAKDSEGNLVGNAGLFLRKFSIKNEYLLSGVGGDFFVSEKHRILGPAIKLQRTLLESVQSGKLDCIYVMPNKDGLPVFKRVGYREVGQFARLVKYINTTSKLQRLKIPISLSKILGPILDFALKLRSFETWHRFKDGAICEEIQNFDERFDELWEKSRLRFTIIGERSREFLTWKYLNDPDDTHKIFTIFNSDRTEIKGYIIYRIQDNSVDVRDMILPSDIKSSNIFMANFLRHVRKGKPESVVINLLENKNIIDRLIEYNFIRGKNDRLFYFYCPKKTIEKYPFLVKPENWLLFYGDRDT